MKYRRISMTIAVTMLICSCLFISCNARETAGPGEDSQVRQEIVASVRLFEFTKDKLEPWINGITHLRAFGVDYNKAKDKEGLLQYVDEQRVDDFITFSNGKNLKIIWTLNVSSRTLQTELAYVDWLISKGMNIVGFEYGGEFYLPKYAKGQISNSKVMERIRMDGDHNDYLELLNQWVPAFVQRYAAPEYEHILVCASHGNRNIKRDQYRRLWNEKVFHWAGQYAPKEQTFSYSYHFYAGAGRWQGPADEENVLRPEEVDWSFLDNKPPGGRWICTESGYYVTDFSKEQLAYARQFYGAESEALGPHNLFGIHTLTKESTKKNPLALYNSNGITPVGKNFEQWLSHD